MAHGDKHQQGSGAAAATAASSQSTTFTITAPANTRVYVNGWTNAALAQSVTVSFPNTSISNISLKGLGEGNTPMAPQNQSVKVPSTGFLSVNVSISPSVSILQSSTGFGQFSGMVIVASEDQTTQPADNNDSVVLFTYYPGQ
ncbi:MAG TPA: fucose-binding lectin II [Bryobacteraceae bacterium]|jgi:hypothetical protein